MDNSWLFLFLGLFLNILYDIAKPWGQSYLKNRSISSRERKIKRLLGEYKIIKGLKDVMISQGFNIIVLRELSRGLFQLTITVILVGVSVLAPRINYTISSIIAFGVAYQGTGAYRTFKFCFRIVDNAIHFERYKQETIRKLKKLGGNPEDLDKEETA